MFCLAGLITLVDGSVLEEESSFEVLGLPFSSKLDWGFYIISIAKTASNLKIGALFCSVKFLSPEVVLYLYKSTIWPCMKYCCYGWAGAPSCCLEMLDKLQKHVGLLIICCLTSILGLSKFSQLKSFL